ncbi:hypothetical protein Y032_0044g910 [Ancylostoma ceylanicum]|uniref:Uncharacterized protein n=1 Tax=Ancylostoma ceylanicum TaxID=53326 RepID=A0A016UFA6_9BILA|nr:hypothetical protein Y032_0044g910 [Ancylostoma ceylanicum]
MESYPSSVEKLSRRKSFSPFARLTNTWDSIIVSPYDSMRSRYVVFVIVMESRFIKLKAIPAQVFLSEMFYSGFWSFGELRIHPQNTQETLEIGDLIPVRRIALYRYS